MRTEGGKRVVWLQRHGDKLSRSLKTASAPVTGKPSLVSRRRHRRKSRSASTSRTEMHGAPRCGVMRGDTLMTPDVLPNSWPDDLVHDAAALVDKYPELKRPSWVEKPADAA